MRDVTWPELPNITEAGAPRLRPAGWRRLVVSVVVLAWFVGWLSFVVWCRARTFTMGYAFAGASAQQHRLLDEERSLELELTSLRSPDRVGELAARRMGLRPPRPEDVVRLATRKP